MHGGRLHMGGSGSIFMVTSHSEQGVTFDATGTRVTDLYASAPPCERSHSQKSLRVAGRPADHDRPAHRSAVTVRAYDFFERLAFPATSLVEASMLPRQCRCGR